jgi:hypothetical protein
MPDIKDIHVDAVLTSISIAYVNAGFVADLVMPRVKVKKESNLFYKYGREKFRIPETLRAVKTEYKRVDWTVTTDTYQCHEYGLEEPIDDRERDNADDPLDLDIDTTEYVSDLVMLDREKRVADLLTTAANFTNTDTLAGVEQWSDYTNSDPIDDVEVAKNAINAAIGLDPNVMVMSREVYLKLKHHPQILERIKYSQKGIISVDLLKAIFEIENIWIAFSLYDTALEGQTPSLSRIWGKHVLLAYITPRPGIKKMSLGYSFNTRKRQTENYREEKIKSDVIRVSEVIDEKLVMETAGYLYRSVVA